MQGEQSPIVTDSEICINVFMERSGVAEVGIAVLKQVVFTRKPTSISYQINLMSFFETYLYIYRGTGY